MPFKLPLPKRLANPWAVKIRDKECLEPPHVTVLRGMQAWRWNLRSGGFMDKEPDPAEVPRELVELIVDHWAELRAKWDAMYPENRVRSDGEERSDE